MFYDSLSNFKKIPLILSKDYNNNSNNKSRSHAMSAITTKTMLSSCYDINISAVWINMLKDQFWDRDWNSQSNT